MTKGVAIECAPFDIRVNAICPAGMPGANFMVHDAVHADAGRRPTKSPRWSAPAILSAG